MEKKINFLEACKNYFITQQNANFWVDEIMKLSQIWQKLVKTNGKYIVE